MTVELTMSTELCRKGEKFSANACVQQCSVQFDVGFKGATLTR